MGKKKEPLKEQLDIITKKLESDWLDKDAITKEIILDEDICWINKPCIEIAGNLVGGILLSYLIHEYESRYNPRGVFFWIKIDINLLSSKFYLTPKQIVITLETLHKNLSLFTVIVMQNNDIYVMTDIEELKELMIKTASAKNYLKSKTPPKINHEDNYQCYIMSHSYMIGPPLSHRLFLPFDTSWLKYFTKKGQIDMRLYYMAIENIDNITASDIERAGLLEILVAADRIEFTDYYIILDEASDIFEWYKRSTKEDPIDNPFESLVDKKFIQLKEEFNKDIEITLLYIKINREFIGEQLKRISQLPKQKKVMRQLRALFTLINEPEKINNDYQIN